jgi:hypothetical protein
MKAANERPRISSTQTLLLPPQHESCALFCPQLTTLICTCTPCEPEKVVLLEQAQTLAPMVHRRTPDPLQKSIKAPLVHLTVPPAQLLRRRVGFQGGSQAKRPKGGPWRSCMAPTAPTQGRMDVGAFLRFLQNKGVGSSNLFRDKTGKKLLVLWGCDHHTAKCDDGSLRSRSIKESSLHLWLSVLQPSHTVLPFFSRKFSIALGALPLGAPEALILPGIVQSQTVAVVTDTGATDCWIDGKCCQHLELPVTPVHPFSVFYGVNNHAIYPKGTC